MTFTNVIAPDFELWDQNKNKHKLSDYSGSYIVLYFYPKDMTPGCTIEAHQFQQHQEDFKKKNTIILGVSADDVDTHLKFCNKENLDFPLLSDIEHEVCKKYGVWVEKSMFGKKYMGINRETFLIDPNGKIIKHYKKVKPLVHATEILKDLKSM